MVLTFVLLQIQQSEDAIRADGIYIPSIKEEKKREKQIHRYVHRRPVQVQDLPDFGEYFVDVHNEPVKRPYGFDDVDLVHEEVAENRAAGIEPPADPRREEVDEALFHKHQAEIKENAEAVDQDPTPREKKNDDND